MPRKFEIMWVASPTFDDSVAVFRNIGFSVPKILLGFGKFRLVEINLLEGERLSDTSQICDDAKSLFVDKLKRTHACNARHNDISLSNIFLTRDGDLELIDWEFCSLGALARGSKGRGRGRGFGVYAYGDTNFPEDRIASCLLGMDDSWESAGRVVRKYCLSSFLFRFVHDVRFTVDRTRSVSRDVCRVAKTGDVLNIELVDYANDGFRGYTVVDWVYFLISWNDRGGLILKKTLGLICLFRRLLWRLFYFYHY